MFVTVEEFRKLENKRITLLGMSGSGKTYLSRKLMQTNNWFHYSGDYRIGTRYLHEPILDNIKHKLMKFPSIGSLLKNDTIYVANNISIDNIEIVTDFLGKPGNPKLGGLPMSELKKRHKLHHNAEIHAMQDVPDFIEKSQKIYGYKHFINDAGGSLCDLDCDKTLEILEKNTIIIYIHTGEKNKKSLLERASSNPKPLYYKAEYIDKFIKEYLQEHNLEYVACIDPDKFTRWVFPKLLDLRTPAYNKIATKFGYQTTFEEMSNVNNEEDFFKVVERAIINKNSN
jgi:hypothetical protein